MSNSHVVQATGNERRTGHEACQHPLPRGPGRKGMENTSQCGDGCERALREFCSNFGHGDDEHSGAPVLWDTESGRTVIRRISGRRV